MVSEGEELGSEGPGCAAETATPNLRGSTVEVICASDGKRKEACPAEVRWIQENSYLGMMDAFACNMMSYRNLSA